MARWQLGKLGFTRDAIRSLLVRGHLHRVHRSVYAVGHTDLSVRGHWMAAVLACGRDAVLSHRAAVSLHDLRPIPGGPIDVTVPARSRRGRAGIRTHSVQTLHPDDRDTVESIPVTEIHRALLDYAEIASREQLRHAIEAGMRQEVLDQRKFDALLARSRGRHGVKALRAVLAELNGPVPWTQSELERAFLSLIRRAGLPEPLTQVLIEGERVDFFWPDANLLVEIDGYEFHKSRAKFEDDRRRDAKLMVAGYRVLRVTQPRLQLDSKALLSQLISLRGAGAAGR